MPSWIKEHRADIRFVVTMLVGVAVIAYGIVYEEMTLLLLGGGAIGLPGFGDLVKEDEPDDDKD